MYYTNACGAYSDSEYVTVSNKDKIALLKEKAAILEAKLATVRYWIEAQEKEEGRTGEK